MSSPPFADAVCPFCGLGCDDLILSAGPAGLSAQSPACPRAVEAYARVGARLAPGPQAWIQGQAASLDAAVAEATRLFAHAQAPLIDGLATDVVGMRGLMELADARGAVVDHMNSEGKLRNLRTVQDQGWITTTLAEVRNRCDLLVCFGSDFATSFPRFFERCVWPAETLFAPSPEQREVVLIGVTGDAALATSPGGRVPQRIDVAPDRLAEVAALLRGFAADSLPDTLASDLPVAELRALVERLRAARYGVIAWGAADLDWPHAELTVQALAAAISALNLTTRCAGLPLGGSDGDFSSDAVMLWQTGYPFRTSLASGTGRYDPVMHSAARVLAEREVDLLLWVASFDPTRGLPMAVACPVIALTCVGTPLLPDVAVQITVATPGVDGAGYLFRADKVVTLPLRASIDRQLPAVGALARRIHAGLGVTAC